MRGPSRDVVGVGGKPGAWVLKLSCGHRVLRVLYRPRVLGRTARAYCIRCSAPGGRR